MNINKQTDSTLLIIRLMLGLLILLHGYANLVSGYAFIGSVMTSAGLPEFLAYGAFAGEIVAPVLIIIGFRTRLASLALAFTMFVAIALVHAGEIFALNQFGGWAIELQALYLFGSLAVFFSGSGKYALSVTNNWD